MKRDGADINDYSADSNTLTIHHSAAYGSLEITLRKKEIFPVKLRIIQRSIRAMPTPLW